MAPQPGRQSPSEGLLGRREEGERASGAHNRHVTITFDLETESINPRSTHFVSGSAPGIRAHSTAPLPATGRVACGGL